MSDRSSPLEGDGENLLQSALATAFIPAPTFRQSQSFQPSPAPPPPAGDPAPVEVDLSSSVSTDDSWKSEYESQVQSWRAQSAEAREKAERERARWEEIRARERQEGGSGDRKVRETAELTPSPVDVRDSSYSSLSFPSPSCPTSPSHSHRTRLQPTPHHAHHTNPQATRPSPNVAPVATSTSLAIFDSNLSIQTRLGALISSLGINLVLPFVNGVMLGFGEIFAKNIVTGWLGWKLPGSGIANVGIRSSTSGRR